MVQQISIISTISIIEVKVEVFSQVNKMKPQDQNSHCDQFRYTTEVSAVEIAQLQDHNLIMIISDHMNNTYSTCDQNSLRGQAVGAVKLHYTRKGSKGIWMEYLFLPRIQTTFGFTVINSGGNNTLSPRRIRIKLSANQVSSN